MNSKKVIIATHNAKFHADDVFSIVILKKVFGNIEVVRTREEDLLKKADFRVDVGGKYNHETKDYDHHQEGSPVRNNRVPYAACGLVWKHYGRKLVNSEKAFDYVDEKLIQYSDSIDSGVELEKGEVYNLSIGEAVEMFGSNWNEDKTNDECFNEAVDFAFLFFERLLVKVNSVLEGEKDVDKCLIEMKDNLVILSRPRLPKGKLCDSSAKIYIESNNVGTWVAVGVPIKPKSFIRKIYFPDSWAGLLDEELERASGIKGLTFCHKHKFIIVGKTKKAVLEASKLAQKN